MEEMIKMKSEKRNYKLMPLLLNAPKYLTFKVKPDKNKSIKNKRNRLKTITEPIENYHCTKNEVFH